MMMTKESPASFVAILVGFLLLLSNNDLLIGLGIVLLIGGLFAPFYQDIFLSRFTGTKVDKELSKSDKDMSDQKRAPLPTTDPRDPDLLKNINETQVIGNVPDMLIRALRVEIPDVREQAAIALGELRDSKAIQPLIVTLRDKDTRVVRSATDALLKYGAEAVDALVVALRDKDPNVRELIADILGKLGDSRAIQPLIDALQDEVYTVRSTAIEGLLKLNDPKVITPLIQAMLDNDPIVHDRALRAVVKLGHQSLEPLIETLKKGQLTIRLHAIHALVALKDNRAIDALVDALDDPESEISFSAIDALGKLGDSRAIQPLVDALSRTEVGARWRATDALGELWRFRDSVATKALIRALRDKDPRVVGSAADALAKIGDREATDELINVLRGGESPASAHAIDALVALKDNRAIDALIDALNDKTPQVAENAADALVKFGQYAVKSVIDILENGNYVVRQHAVEVLGKIKDDRARDPLIAALGDNYPSVRSAAVQALSSFDDPQVQEAIFSIALKDIDNNVRGAANRILNELKINSGYGTSDEPKVTYEEPKETQLSPNPYEREI